MSNKDTAILNRAIAKLAHPDSNYGSQALWKLISQHELPHDNQREWANMIVREATKIAMDETIEEMEGAGYGNDTKG